MQDIKIFANSVGGDVLDAPFVRTNKVFALSYREKVARVEKNEIFV